ncbi:MAG: hypothetical protein Phog2KO_16500 [Phototrophicaceae bacterium]
MKEIDYSDNNPRTVSRGLKLQNIFLGVDSLYLVIEYPHADVYSHWTQGLHNLQDKRLFDGIPFGDVLIRRGGLGYKLSVWMGDSRLFITDRVDDRLVDTGSAGQGMGLMLQLGSKWLRQYADFTSYETLSASIYALLVQFHVKEPEKYAIRINRIDVALDVVGLPVSEFSVDEWRYGWVGRASGKHFYDDASTGNLSGLAIGSSRGAVRFKVYDKILEAQKSGDLMFWLSVWSVDFSEVGLDFDLPPSVARFEWTIKPHGAKFIGMQYLKDYSFDGLKELINYVTTKWGRFCVPHGDKNQSRWEIHPLWVKIRRMMIEEWDIDHVGVAKRDYHTSPDLNPAYMSSVTGWIAGLMARVGLAQGYDTPADIYEAVMMAQDQSEPVMDKANKKWAIMSRLFGKNKNE